MAISAIRPLRPAFERARWILFRPIQVGKWLALGFCAWLCQMGDGGWSGFLDLFVKAGAKAPPPAPPPRAQGPLPWGFPAQMGEEYREFFDWIGAHLTPVLIIAAIIIAAGVAIWIALAWVKSRARFMFLDDVIYDRGAVAEPWAQFRAEGNSLFRASLVLGLAWVAGHLVIDGISLIVAMPDIQARRYMTAAKAASTVGVPLNIVLWSLAATARIVLDDFVVAIMYLRRCSALAAWDEFRRELLPGRAGAFACYLLVRMAIGLVAGLFEMALLAVPFSPANLPYVGALLLLPFSTVVRLYSLEFLGQFGEPWRVFGPVEETAPDEIIEDLD